METKESFKSLVEIVAFKAKKSQEQLAIEMGYGKTYISEIFTPKGKLSPKFIEAFKKHYAHYLKDKIERDEPLSPIVREIQYKKNWSVEQVAESIGYSRQQLYNDSKMVEVLLREKHADILQPTPQGIPYEKYIEELKQDKAAYLDIIKNNLSHIGISLAKLVEIQERVSSSEVPAPPGSIQELRDAGTFEMHRPVKSVSFSKGDNRRDKKGTDGKARK